MKASHRQHSLVLQVKKEKSASGAKSVHVNSRPGGYLFVFFLNKATLVVIVVHPSTVAHTRACNAAEEGRGKKGGLRESEHDGMTSENSPRRGPAPCCFFYVSLGTASAERCPRRPILSLPRIIVSRVFLFTPPLRTRRGSLSCSG